MVKTARRGAPGVDLSASSAAAVHAFRRHLEAERDLSVHTVRAYTGDVTALLAHAGARGFAEPGALDVSVLRSWLGSLAADCHSWLGPDPALCRWKKWSTARKGGQRSPPTMPPRPAPPDRTRAASPRPGVVVVLLGNRKRTADPAD